MTLRTIPLRYDGGKPTRVQRIGIVALVTVLVALIVPVSAQEELRLSISSLDDSRFPEVTALVAADRLGRPITDVALADLQIEESGSAATPLSVARAIDSNMPLAVVMTVDMSGSMRGEPAARVKAAATSLLNNLSRTDRTAVLSFSDEVLTEQPFSQDRQALRNTITRLQAVDKGTALYDAVAESARLAASSDLQRRAVIFLTDGMEPPGQFARSRVSQADSLAAAAASSSPFYVVGLGSEIDRQYLEELARRSQGRYFHAPQPAQLTDIYATIDEALRSQLVITFQSTGVADLQERSARVSLRQGTVSGRAELAYRSRRPPSPPSLPPWIALVPLVALLAVMLLLRRTRHTRVEGEITDMTTPLPAAGSRTVVAPWQATIVVERNPMAAKARSYEVGQVPVTIGSGESCHIQLPAAEGVAAQHARIWMRDGRLMMHYLASEGNALTKGRAETWAGLDDGDEISIGPYLLRCLIPDRVIETAVRAAATDSGESTPKRESTALGSSFR